jgi:hypothetical protein
MKNYLAILLLVATLNACSPNGITGDNVQAITGGGKGGNTTLAVIPTHINKGLGNATAYIKYAASTAPANGVYDDSAQCIQDTIATATFSSLKTGIYYVLAKGHDTTAGGILVSGGMVVGLKQEQFHVLYIQTTP